MPRELKSKDEFQKLLESATEVRVAHRGDTSKLKLRTKKALYTFQMPADEAEAAVKGLKVPVVEV